MSWVILHFIGIISYAASGAFVALEAKYSFIGVYALGLTTAFGGALIRNVVIGVPDNTVTRGQSAKIIVTAAGLDTTNVTNPGFTDVPVTHQFYKYIAALENEGIVGGYSNGKFGVNDPLKRWQMAKILVNSFHIPLVSVYDANLSLFDDASYMIDSHDFQMAFRKNGQYPLTLAFYNLVSGVSPGKFGMYEPLKRSQLALMINKIQSNENKLNALKVINYKKYGITESSTILDESIIKLKANVYQSDIASEYASSHEQGIFEPLKEGTTYIVKDSTTAVKVDVTKKNSIFNTTFTPIDYVPKESKANPTWGIGQLEASYTLRNTVTNEIKEKDIPRYFFVDVELETDDLYYLTTVSLTGEITNTYLQRVEKPMNYEVMHYDVNENNEELFSQQHESMKIANMQLTSGDSDGMEIKETDDAVYLHYKKPGIYTISYQEQRYDHVEEEIQRVSYIVREIEGQLTVGPYWK